jgi:nicotinamidase-related amidase
MKLVLLVVDMVEDFVTGKYGGERAQAIIPTIDEIISTARKNNIKVVYLKDAHSGDDPELTVWGDHSMKGKSGSIIVDELKPLDVDLVVEKQVYSGFYGSELGSYMGDRNIDTIIFTGVCTDICIQHNVADAFYRGFKCLIVTDGTATVDSLTHESALNYMKKIYGAELVDSKRAKEIIEGAG